MPKEWWLSLPADKMWLLLAKSWAPASHADVWTAISTQHPGALAPSQSRLAAAGSLCAGQASSRKPFSQLHGAGFLCTFSIC